MSATKNPLDESRSLSLLDAEDLERFEERWADAVTWLGMLANGPSNQREIQICALLASVTEMRAIVTEKLSSPHFARLDLARIERGDARADDSDEGGAS